MRKGLLLMVAIGLGGLVLLTLLAQFALESNPAIHAIVDLRKAAGPLLGDRLVALGYAPAPAPAPGQPGHGLRAVFRPEVGPNARTREQQANELADWLLSQYGWGDSLLPPLAFVDVRGYTDAEHAWIRVTRAARHAVAPPPASGYPPRPPDGATTASPGGAPR